MPRDATPPAPQPDLDGHSRSDRLDQDLRRFVGSAADHQRLQSSRALAQRYQVSHSTVMAVIDRLAAEGLVYKAHGKGSFVAAHAPRRPRVVFTYIDNSLELTFYRRAFQGVLDAAQQLRWYLEVRPFTRGAYTQWNQDLIDDAGRDVDGILAPWIEPATLREIRQRNPRLCLLAMVKVHPGLELPAVTVDPFSLGVEAACYLLDRRVARVVSVHANAQFEAGVRYRLEQHTTPPAYQAIAHSRGGNVAATAAAVFVAQPQALVISDDRLAAGVLGQLSTLAPGLLEKLCIIAPTNAGENLLPPHVVRLESDGYQLGQAAVQALTTLLSGKSLPNLDIHLKPQLVIPPGHEPLPHPAEHPALLTL